MQVEINDNKIIEGLKMLMQAAPKKYSGCSDAAHAVLFDRFYRTGSNCIGDRKLLNIADSLRGDF